MQKKIILTWFAMCLGLVFSVHVSGIKTNYRVFGHGQPILIINGGPGMNSDGFATLAKTIADLGYQTIIYDQRGTGGSKLTAVNSKTITMNLMAADIEDLRKELNIKQWTVLGHSFGGILACHYYAKYPSSVRKLIFSSSGGVNLNFINGLSDRILSNLSALEKDSFLFYQQKMDSGDTTYSVRRKRAEYLACAYVFNRKYAPLIAERLLQVNYDVNQWVFQDLRKIKYNYLHRFKNAPVPVLILQGNKDILTMETAREIQASFRKAKLVELNNCAHYGWLDAPDIYIKAIRDFLSQAI
ncbi:MAG: alpha/beta hydrolase [Chitinophagaceae bacterium]|nr:alpha/beta hydrolase [Chitinophagaceae bacterium]